MKNFATLLSNYVSANNRLTYYQRLSKDCVDSALKVPNDKKDFYLIKSKWALLREEFPGVYSPGLNYYPAILDDYMHERISFSQFEERTEKCLERIKNEEMFMKRYVEDTKKELLWAYRSFKEINDNNDELKEVLDFVTENPERIMELLSAEFGGIG